nr:hypothetical protein [Micromonospora tarensis]
MRRSPLAALVLAVLLLVAPGAAQAAVPDRAAAPAADPTTALARYAPPAPPGASTRPPAG